MNRFRTKKKAKDTNDVVPRQSNDSDAPAIPLLKTTMTFRKGKKNNNTGPEPKPEIDLTNALPSSDEFRTSLLMSGLSARFSMLREQDDPNSKLGKASDDSVLLPKRQSHKIDFGLFSNGLSDIAEVASIKSSIRPPFSQDRANSYYAADGYGAEGDNTAAGDIMARTKPSHGNNLFGGRQKVYKIPTTGSASAKNLAAAAESGAMAGRALYDDDLSMSAFQRLRERERQQRDEEQSDAEAAQASQPRRSSSPPLSGYNRNRETSSTTDSGPSLTRISTAATSVTSQRTPSVNGQNNTFTPAKSLPSNNGGIERSATKTKRLYETGLDQQFHNQQHSAMSRLDSLSRQRPFDARTPSPGVSSPTHTTFEISETSAINKPQGSEQPDQGRPGGNPGTFDFGVNSTPILDTPKLSQGASPPLSPRVSEGDEQQALPIQPNDRGKATALGAFSKPAQPYDEKKYMQRQLQLQQGRSTPPRRHSPPRSYKPAQPPFGRMRAESSSTYSSGRSRSSSSVQREFVPANRAFPPSTAKPNSPAPLQNNKFAATVLTSPNGSAVSSPKDASSDCGIISSEKPPPLHFVKNILSANSMERPPESEHPANRQPSSEESAESRPESRDDDVSLPQAPSAAPARQMPEVPRPKNVEDSPTLGPTAGLSGLVRQHLRSESSASSIYGAPPPGLAPRYNDSDLPNESEYNTKGNPWEVNDWDQDYDLQQNAVRDEPRKAGVQLGRLANTQAPLNLSNVQRENQLTSKPSWENEIVKQHARDGSTETQKERDEFANELAARRKRVQETLRKHTDPESRSGSPTLGTDRPKDASFSRSNPRGVFKSIPSRESLIVKSKDGQTKAMKMLGISGSIPPNGPTPGNPDSSDSMWKQEEAEMLRGVAKASRMPPQTRAFREARRNAQRDRERDVFKRHQQRVAAESSDSDAIAAQREPRSRRDSPSPKKSPESPVKQRSQSRERAPRVLQSRAPSEESKRSAGASNQSESRPPSRGIRDRSSSDVSGRSKSGNGRYRDDLAKAMAEGTGTSARATLDEAPPARGAARSPAMGAGMRDLDSPRGPVPSRSGSNDQPARTGYFDDFKGQPIQTNQPVDIGLSPRPSPITPYSINSTPACVPQSSTGSGAGTPTSQGFQSQGPIPAARKRSVNKADISEPTLVSSTSRVTTVNLPPGAHLQNGAHQTAPPLPPINPRRRQTKTQTMFGVLTGRSVESLPTPSLPMHAYPESFTNFGADEDDAVKKPRQKLRKSSSEGGNLNARMRAAFNAQPSPALPAHVSSHASSSDREYRNGMF
ncbi:MAG: hypothetical protein M1818_008536 [Claussenomyces sp. TS43310]|nr:MAG: hypothetical protein M1818_008536 [Claussenomyces sp. TS43310]